MKITIKKIVKLLWHFNLKKTLKNYCQTPICIYLIKFLDKYAKSVNQI
jgi:hypothetical protein